MTTPTQPTAPVAQPTVAQPVPINMRWLVSACETIGMVVALIFAILHNNHDAFVALASALTAHGLIHN